MVIAGKERMRRKEVNNAIHVNTGRRIIVMPGARMLMIVTMKLSEAAIEAMLALGPPARAPKFKVGDGVRVPVEMI